MLKYAIIFALISLVAGALGFSGVAAGAAGIAKVEPLGLDTYADEARFFSFRRATHRAEPDYGRQISLIGLPV